MCGIFGWIPVGRFQNHDAREAALTLEEKMRHRGPNDAGFVIFPAQADKAEQTEQTYSRQEAFRLLLGQTRLSILDLSPAGHQPMRSACGRYTLTYNGEVYNYRELRDELRAEGVSFHSETDTEVVLQALIRWGKSALCKFSGMFAFAMFDAQKNTLFCARDFFGIKPFFWHLGETGFCFASEIPALLCIPGIPRKVDPVSAYQYLCYGQYDTGPSTMLAHVQSLPPAHCCTIQIGNLESLSIERYWQPEINAELPISFDDAAAQLRQIFLDSVRLHLRSDVPLGTALSGGIDSSAVTCAVRHLEPEADLHTFSFIAPGSDVSEEAWADMVAVKTGAIHHTVTVQPEDLRKDMDALLLSQGEPFGSTSIYAQYRVFQLARECGITVTLDGQGADELLAGYHGYPGPRFASLLRAGNLGGACRFLKASHQWPGRTWGYLVKQSAREFVPEWLTPLALRCVGRSAAPAWLDTEQLRQEGVSLLRQDIRQQLYPSSRRLKQTLAYQLTWNGLPQLLRHGDRNAMAHSIESRVPFLTKEMAEFCMSLPEEYLVDMQGCSKSIFRKAMRGLVPDAVLDRKDKVGFATPERQWIHVLSDWVEATLADAASAPFLRMDAARKEWRSIRDGHSPFDWRVWRWLCYVRWAQLMKIER